MNITEKVEAYLDRALRYLNTPHKQHNPGEYAALMACKAEIREEAMKGASKDMKTFAIEGTEYTVEEVTAICGCELEKGEKARQSALLVTSEHNGETMESVVFGYEMPESNEGFAEMCTDWSAWESDGEVIATVNHPTR